MQKVVPFHPLLIALFPVLALYQRNIDGFPLSVIIVPATILVLAVVFGWLLLHLMRLHALGGALVLSMFFLIFFSYGHIYSVCWLLFTRYSLILGPDKMALTCSGVLLVIGFFFVQRLRDSFVAVTRLANYVSIILIAMPILQIGVSVWQSSSPSLPDYSINRAAGNSAARIADEIYPDIYYLILDGYARADVLEEIYGYHNRELLDYLARKGFHLAPRAHANYCQTALSICSSLNMQYLDSIAAGLGFDSQDRRPLASRISHSRLFALLHDFGYLGIALSSGYSCTELRNADSYIETGNSLWFLDEFQNGLLTLTPLPPVWRKLAGMKIIGRHLGEAQARAHRDRILRTFAELAKVPRSPGPKVVFVHSLVPHPPFVFGAHGEPTSVNGIFTFDDGSHLVKHDPARRKSYVQQYVKQLTFINHLLIEALDSIFMHSVRPPIVILQADHGPGSQLDWDDIGNTNLRERFAILNAYYLPDGGDTVLYNTITPVNTFRLVLDYYCGTELGLLPDRSFFSSYDSPYRFVEVTDQLSSTAESKPTAVVPAK